MTFQIGAMTVGDILDRGMKLLFARLPTFFIITLIVQLPVVVIPVVLIVLYQHEGLSVMLTAGGAAWLLQAILQPIGVAAVLYVVAQEFIERRAGVAEAFRAVLRRCLSIVFGTFVFGLVVLAGGVLCCFPAFLFLSWFSLFSQVIMVEGLGALKAFDRSKELSEGYRLRILGLWLLLFVVLQMVLGGSVGLVLGTFFPTADVVQTRFGPMFHFNIQNVIINQVASFPVNALVITYTSVCMTLLYFDLRIRKEGFDLEIAAQRLGSQDEPTPLD